MDYKFFLRGIINSILNSPEIWDSGDNEISTPRFIRNNILLPLIILVSVSAFAGSLLFANERLTFAYSILTGVKCFVLMYFTIYATSYIFSEITYPMDLGKDFSVSFRIIVFSTIPFLICQIFSRIFESLLFINLLGFFGLFIFWSGIGKIINPPMYKKIPLTIATTLTMAGIYILSNMLLDMITDRLYYLLFA